MFESQVTGKCGGFLYMLSHLISRGQNGLFWNLKWRHLVYEDYGVYAGWFYEPFFMTHLIRPIKTHKFLQVLLVLAGIGDTFIWLNILNII